MVDNKQAMGQVQIDYETKNGPEDIAINIPFEQALGLINKTHMIVPAEPTEEMLEAGFRIFEDSGLVEETMDADKLVLEDIYKAMIKDNK